MFFYAPTLGEMSCPEMSVKSLTSIAVPSTVTDEWMSRLYIIIYILWMGMCENGGREHTRENLGETSRMVLNESLTNCNVVSVRKSTVRGLLFLFGGWLIYQNFRVCSVLVVIRFRLLLSVTDVIPRGFRTWEKVRGVGIYPTEHKVPI